MCLPYAHFLYWFATGPHLAHAGAPGQSKGVQDTEFKGAAAVAAASNHLLVFELYVPYYIPRLAC